MHRVFKLYQNACESELIVIEDEKGVPGKLCLRAVGLFQLRQTISSRVKPDTFELQLADRDIWIEDDESNWLHGISPFSQTLSDF